jgi:hypothetical protein
LKFYTLKKVFLLFVNLGHKLLNFKENGGVLDHIESRLSLKKAGKGAHDIFLEVRASAQNLARILASVKDSKAFPNITILSSQDPTKEGID